MRLWHYKLIPFLPKSQLLAQWRELNSIFKNQPKNILINYVYEHPLVHICTYSKLVIREMKKRGYKIRSYEAFIDYCHLLPIQAYIDDVYEGFIPFPHRHNDEYLAICYFNLLEKYRRGQKDFDIEKMHNLTKCCTPAIEKFMSQERLREKIRGCYEKND